jgi:hypothetical protein
LYLSEHTKHRRSGDPGRPIPVVAEIKELCDAHYAAGYPSEKHFATSPEGMELRWANIKDEYVLPAFKKVLGTDTEFALKNFRKSSITWLIAYGMRPDIAALHAGHSQLIQGRHYAGAYIDANGHRMEGIVRLWSGWQDAWDAARAVDHRPWVKRP